MFAAVLQWLACRVALLCSALLQLFLQWCMLHPTQLQPFDAAQLWTLYLQGKLQLPYCWCLHSDLAPLGALDPRANKLLCWLKSQGCLSAAKQPLRTPQYFTTCSTNCFSNAMDQHVLRGFARPGEVLLHMYLPFVLTGTPSDSGTPGRAAHCRVELLVVELLHQDSLVGR